MNSFINKIFIITIITICFGFSTFAGGIKGTVKNTHGEYLSFASIIVKGSSKGTMANEDGKYELALDPGNYTIIFQYLGHKTLEKQVVVNNDYLPLEIVLEEQAISLKEVEFSAKSEDPAYTIMRKAISMARFKILELNEYSARTYVKGTGQVSEVSGLIKMLAGKKIEKESGLKIGQVYVLESINDVIFKQPSSVREKVVSTRNNLPKQLQSQGTNFIPVSRTNFYNPKPFGDMVSPLSPTALAYYKFKYEGFFTENGQTVNKIRVTPKSKNDNVFDGIINIIEDSWYIHSLDLHFSSDNISNRIKMIFAPNKEIWLPINYTFRSDFDAFGFKGFFNYVTNVRNYTVAVNEKYHQRPVVIDEKIDKAEAKELKSEKVNSKIALNQKQVTRKQLNKFLKEAEKEDKKERKKKGEDIDLVRSYNVEIDSLHSKRSADFWNEERQVPLTDLEIKGYAQADSIAKTNEQQYQKDSIRNLPAFKFSHLIFGKTYNYGKRDDLFGFFNKSLSYTSPLDQIPSLDFVNTVDGYFLKASLRYDIREKLTKRQSFYGDLRYALGRKALNWNLGYYYLKNQQSIEVKTGRYIQQFNDDRPISTPANTIYTMLAERNYLKIYQKDYASIEYRNRLSEKVTIRLNLEYAERMALKNLETFKPWIDVKDRSFSSNTPENAELANTDFEKHKTFLTEGEIIWRPFAKKRKFNDREYTINTGNPIFRLKSTNGLLSESQFSRLQGSYEQFFDLEKLGNLHVLTNYGGFIQKPNYFIDYRHFNGNQTILRSFRFDAFRNLDYYLHSTTGNYLEVFAQHDFNHFLLTQITPLRIYGLKESVFANYLKVPNQQFEYVEVGYGLSGIGKLFGLEVVGNFVNGKYDATVLRIKFNR
ncbi:DUF5686 and carboxypeptidase regulatory-like domain-containing protein [Arcicella aquatica]|uniref:DUF5686 and carboxypeptidase regulatory-like domain-containing protein n=1 Tax=Arcicella aquatica TaxID=217141 RepID=A0ABU5QK92_9BACT|nr:DUF5686 and carboxypeptidase regulatory-like domain-containing protein [Arcicella aquatica]MEA5257249.1 DUF5686 and carboxypeptidase regulatory-like domain-containing protein [Arcicella aquatica]